MWEKITDKKQIENIRVGGFLLQHPTNEQTSLENPTGKEENSEVYNVKAKFIDTVSLELIHNPIEIGGMVINSMARQVKHSDLIKGMWWLQSKVS